MRRWIPERMAAGGAPLIVCAAACLAGGCKSDFNQQVLERELRMQEDQIYHLQDELQAASARLSRVASENVSLKKQLGIADGGGPALPASAPNRFLPTPATAPKSPAGIVPPVLVPPTIDDVPPPAATLPPPAGDGPRFGPPGDAAPSFRSPAAPPASLPAAPTLEGVPPLPDEPVAPRDGAKGASATNDPAVRPVSHDESLAVEAKVTHLVLNRDRTRSFDGDGDGLSDGLTIVFEPRDGDERLVTAAGDVSVAVYEPTTAGATNPSGEGDCIARWEVPAAQAASQFRRTSRARGVHLVERWPGPPPASDHVRVFVRMTTFEGKSFETDATVPVTR